ncbi:hypothetical protein [Legionella yabuuchiae]|uniref:hypothetical protein n=1 Tax=Legionella yabuuchiae TaxID=376727 RepID=UPI0010553770|nr:hypothetical protein [Legionella yabuuchiae]
MYSARMFKTAVLRGSLGAGSAYLLNEVRKYKELEAQLKPTHPGIEWQKRPRVVAEEKEWLIFGRQSPGYARDDKLVAKKSMKLTPSSLFIKKLGTILDNEKYYHLFKGSDFEVVPCTGSDKTPTVIVQPDKMLSTALTEIKDDAQFEIGFARKRGFIEFVEKSPFFHSSIALRRVTDKKPANPDAVVMTGAEIKKVIAETNHAICESEHCDLFRSNCYSASIFALGTIIKVINAREEPAKQKSEEIQKVHDVIAGAAFDNFARGVSNNGKVKSLVTSDIPKVLDSLGLSTSREEPTTGISSP